MSASAASTSASASASASGAADMQTLWATIDEGFKSVPDHQNFFQTLGHVLGAIAIEHLIASDKLAKMSFEATKQKDKFAGKGREQWLEVFKQIVGEVLTPRGKALDPVSERKILSQLMQEFATPYKDPEGKILSYLLDSINERYLQWSKHPTTWYAPCTAIVQSSGWGKSRAVREIAMESNQVMVFYFSLMLTEHTGYPKADERILTYFKTITHVAHGFSVFHACFQWLYEQDSFPSKQALFEDHEKMKYERVYDRLQQNRDGCTPEIMVDVCSKALDKHKEALKGDGIRFLFVFDEARMLLQSNDEERESPFVLLKRASSFLHAGCRSFVLFIDTTSRVSNFTTKNSCAGLSRKDYSSKVVKGQGKLFAPFSRLPTFDVARSANPSSSLGSLDQLASPEVWLKQGRPLWAAKEFMAEEWVTNILELALQKLCAGTVWDSTECKKLLQNSYMSLVLLGRRVGVDICPQSPTAQDLVASHMSVCLHVSASREYVLCTSLPEPALNEAAAHAFRRKKDLLDVQLRQLNSLLLKGIASAGERGELVARILLIIAMDKLQREEPYTKPVHLKVFLTAFSPSFKDFPESLKHLKGAKVFFNSFHRCFGKASVRDARKFIKKGAAMICPAMQEAFDLFIFFVKPGSNQEYYVEDDDNIGCLGVQVKNWKEASGISSTLRNMESYERKASADEIVPDVKVLLHVGVNVEGKGTVQELVQRGSFVFKGCPMESLENDIRSTIGLLLCESPNPISIMQKETRDDYANSDEKELDATLSRETSALESILSAVYPEVPAEGIKPKRKLPGKVKVDVNAEVTAYPEVKMRKAGNKRTLSSMVNPVAKG